MGTRKRELHTPTICSFQTKKLNGTILLRNHKQEYSSYFWIFENWSLFFGIFLSAVESLRRRNSRWSLCGWNICNFETKQHCCSDEDDIASNAPKLRNNHSAWRTRLNLLEKLVEKPTWRSIYVFPRDTGGRVVLRNIILVFPFKVKVAMIPSTSRMCLCINLSPLQLPMGLKIFIWYPNVGGKGRWKRSKLYVTCLHKASKKDVFYEASSRATFVKS